MFSDHIVVQRESGTTEREYLTKIDSLLLQLSTVTGQLAERVTEIEELKAVVEGRKLDQKKLAAGMTEIEQLNQTIERYIIIALINCI